MARRAPAPVIDSLKCEKCLISCTTTSCRVPTFTRVRGSFADLSEIIYGLDATDVRNRLIEAEGLAAAVPL